jgi:hypothetical protein
MAYSTISAFYKHSYRSQRMISWKIDRHSFLAEHLQGPKGLQLYDDVHIGVRKWNAYTDSLSYELFQEFYKMFLVYGKFNEL